MSEINHKVLRFVLENAYNKMLPVYIRGGIGIGKSRTVRDFAMECALASAGGRRFVAWNDVPKAKKFEVMASPEKYFVFVDQRALMLDLGDFKLPRFDEAGGFEWCIPTVYQHLCQPGAAGILFLDEFNLAPPTIQGMFYSIVQDREIGENHLAEGVYVAAAGNNATDKAAIYEMPYPLRNRFIHVFLAEPSADDWTRWGGENGVDVRILSFIKFKPGLLYKPGFNGDYAFPTPRSWDRLSNGISGIKDHDGLYAMAAATVGDAAAAEFSAYVKLTETVDLDSILDDPENVKKLKEPQMFFSVAGGLIEKYRADNKRLGKIIKVANNMAPEYSIWMVRMMKDIGGPGFGKQVIKATNVDEFHERYGRFLLD